MITSHIMKAKELKVACSTHKLILCLKHGGTPKNSSHLKVTIMETVSNPHVTSRYQILQALHHVQLYPCQPMTLEEAKSICMLHQYQIVNYDKL